MLQSPTHTSCPVFFQHKMIGASTYDPKSQVGSPNRFTLSNEKNIKNHSFAPGTKFVLLLFLFCCVILVHQKLYLIVLKSEIEIYRFSRVGAFIPLPILLFLRVSFSVKVISDDFLFFSFFTLLITFSSFPRTVEVNVTASGEI